MSSARSNSPPPPPRQRHPLSQQRQTADHLRRVQHGNYVNCMHVSHTSPMSVPFVYCTPQPRRLPILSNSCRSIAQGDTVLRLATTQKRCFGTRGFDLDCTSGRLGYRNRLRHTRRSCGPLVLFRTLPFDHLHPQAPTCCSARYRGKSKPQLVAAYVIEGNVCIWFVCVTGVRACGLSCPS